MPQDRIRDLPVQKHKLARGESRMKKTVWISLIALVQLFAPLTATAAIRVMILDGQSGGPYHDWQRVTPVLQKQLEATGLFQVDVVTAPQSGGDFSTFKPEFKKYQVVVSNYDAPEWPAELKASFEQYVKDGGGLVAVHAADNAFPDWPAFNEMIGIGGWRNRTEKAGPFWYYKEGKLVSDNSPGNAGSHGARIPFPVTIRDGEHPITKGLPRCGCTPAMSSTPGFAGLART